MKAVVVGRGFSGKLHLEALRSIGVTVADVLGSGDDLSAALSDGIDAVHICAPPASHGPLIRASIARGINVLCEKPLSSDAAEARELARAGRESGLVTALSLNFRYFPAVARAREIARSGALGEPLLIHGNYLQEFHALPAPRDWRYDTALAGRLRAVSELGPHWLDLAEFISGRRVRAVSALFGAFAPERALSGGLMYPPDALVSGDRIVVSSEDAAALTLSFEGAAIGSVLLSEVSHGRGNRLNLEITFERGSLWWDAEEMCSLHIAKKGDGIRTEIFPFDGGYPATFRALCEEFYGEIRQRRSGEDTAAAALASLSDGARLAAITAAIEESALNGSCMVDVTED